MSLLTAGHAGGPCSSREDHAKASRIRHLETRFATFCRPSAPGGVTLSDLFKVRAARRYLRAALGGLRGLALGQGEGMRVVALLIVVAACSKADNQPVIVPDAA